MSLFFSWIQNYTYRINAHKTWQNLLTTKLGNAIVKMPIKLGTRYKGENCYE